MNGYVGLVCGLRVRPDLHAAGQALGLRLFPGGLLGRLVFEAPASRFRLEGLLLSSLATTWLEVFALLRELGLWEVPRFYVSLELGWEVEGGWTEPTQESRGDQR